MKTTYGFGRVSVDMAGGESTAKLPDPVKPEVLPSSIKGRLPNGWRLVNTCVTPIHDNQLLVVWTWEQAP